MAADDGEIPDFTRERKRIRFRITSDVFEAYPAVPPSVLLEVTSLADQANAALNRINMDSEANEQAMAEANRFIADLLRLLLRPESLDRMLPRLTDRDNPVELDECMRVVEHVMGQWGMRPTVPSDGSANGSESPDGGTSSTATQHPAELTSSASPPTGS